MTLVSDHSIDWLVAMLRDGRDYYRHAEAHTSDHEVRRAFALAADARQALIDDLVAAQMTDAGSSTSAASVESQEMPMQQRYASLRAQFDPARPEQQADALLMRERATLRLMESVFRSHPALVARSLMKKHYGSIRNGSAIMRRLASRQHAA